MSAVLKRGLQNILRPHIAAKFNGIESIAAKNASRSLSVVTGSNFNINVCMIKHRKQKVCKSIELCVLEHGSDE